MYQLKTRSAEGGWRLEAGIKRLEWTRYHIGGEVRREEIVGALKGRWPGVPYEIELVEKDGKIVRSPVLICAFFESGVKAYANNCEAYVLNENGVTVDKLLGKED